MTQRTVFFSGNLSNPYRLRESDDRFVLRVQKNLNPHAVLLKVKGMKELLPKIDQLAEFPDSDVYLFQFKNDFSVSRDEVKSLVRKANIPEIVYIGSVFNYSDTNIYQVYTENIFLKFEDEATPADITFFLSQHDLKLKRPVHFGKNVYFLETVKSQGRDIFSFCEQLLNLQIVELCHPEMVTRLRRISKVQSGEKRPSSVIDKEWWLNRTKIPKAWKYTRGKGSTIAIIDDGIELNHPAFQGKIVSPKDMMDTEGNKLPCHQYSDSHGTACASVAASKDPVAPGVAPDAMVMPIRITGIGSVLQSEAIYWAVNHDADVISCSWGPPDGNIYSIYDDNFKFPLPDHTRVAFEYADKYGRNSLGTPIVIAAGNGNEPVKHDGYASSESVIAVGSLNSLDKKATYSDHGKPLFCVHPSGDAEKDDHGQMVNTGIFVADRIDEAGYSATNYYPLFQGTSASCPGVAGMIALIYSVNPGLSKKQVIKLLKESCEKIPTYHLSSNSDYSKDVGYGLLRADIAITKSKNIKGRPMGTTEKKSGISLHIGINNVSQEYYSNYVNPLFGCVNDMKAMEELAGDLGYETHILEDDEATRENIKSRMVALGNQIEEGGILLITYAGHGAPIPNVDVDGADLTDIKDGNDEAWVTYDGFLIDDEIFETLCEIREKIRVVLVSDSCHSESMARAVTFRGQDRSFSKDKYYSRQISEAEFMQVLRKNNTTVRELRKNITKRSILNYNVFVKTLAACKADEPAQEINQNGVYTSSLTEIFKTIQNDPDINYSRFIELIRNEIRDFQTPMITNSHNQSTAFDSQFPFETGKIPLEPNTKNDTADEIELPVPDSAAGGEQEQLFLETDDLIVESKTRSVDNIVSERKNSRSLDGFTPWDKAYNYLIEHRDEVDFVEPEIISNLYQIETTEGEGRGVGEYLHTYPDPESEGSPQPFIWHLDDDHSQLRSAFEEVFPEAKYGSLNTEKEDIVKIAHIDTGYIPDHPALPVNMEKNGSIDDDAALAITEKQGHGNATISILAGNWVDLDETDNNYRGFFGAIPYAKVLPIKISETVALLSGRRFARAVDYAIEQGCDVITMSMAGLPSKVMAKAVNRAYKAGVVLVSAASNSFSKGAAKILPEKTLYPARYDRVISAVGAAFDKKPYLNKYHPDRSRFAGSLYMQTCYGPKSALPTSLAAYTPNITWFDKIDKNADGTFSYYVKSGGGTSSATPQIAAAAAIYIQKYKAELDKYSGDDAWKKAEIVRQALFQSADASTSYNEIYGNGLIRARKALEHKYSPAELGPEIKKKTKKAPERRRFLGGAIGLLFGRGIGDGHNEELREKLETMMVLEVTQLLHIDEDLFQYQELLDIEEEDNLPLDDPEIINAILSSKFASDFLKRQLTIRQKNLTANVQAANPEVNSHYFESICGNLNIRSQGLEFNVYNKNTSRQYFEGIGYWVDEFELELSPSRSLRSGKSRSLEIEVHDVERDLGDGEHEIIEVESAVLIEKAYEDGVVLEWKSDFFDVEKYRSRSTADDTQASGNKYEFFYDDFASDRGGRGFFKKIAVKVVKWFKGKTTETDVTKLVEELSDYRYEVLVFDLENSTDGRTGWKDIKTLGENEVFEAIEKESKEVLIMLPGLFSKVESGFDEFLGVSENRTKLLKNHCRYVLGFNMPTVVQGIEQNAKEFKELFHGKIKHKKCNVMARSRGGVVARHLFEKTLLRQDGDLRADSPFILNKLIMFGTPNQGTMIASSKNWKSMFNMATNVARWTIGLFVPVVPKVMTVMKAVGLGLVDLPGIDDLEENSDVIRELNDIEMDRSHYFVFTSNFEPSKLFKRLFDEGIVDRAIFEHSPNDSVTPVPGAIFRNEALPTVIKLEENQFHISSELDQVSHFGYLRPKHSIVDRVFDLI